MLTALKTSPYSYNHTARTVLRLLLSREISRLKCTRAMANLGACLFNKQPPFYPTVIQFDVTNTCNLSCPGCLTGLGVYRRPPGKMAFDKFAAVVDEVKDTTALAVLYNSGEPMMHPQLAEMVAHLSAADIASIISTNGHFIDSADKAEALIHAGTSLIIFSLSGATQNTYEMYHAGGDLNMVLRGISLLADAKKRLRRKMPVILVRLLIMPHNLHELDAMKTMAEKYGGEIIETRMIRWRTEIVATREQLPHPTDTPRLNPRNKVCLWPWLISVINWDGMVTPCCFFNLDLPEMGNAFAPGGFRQVWQGHQYRHFRQRMRRGKNTIPICRQCPAETGFQTTFSRQDRTIRVAAGHMEQDTYKR
ncbi:MAG: radical SAM protein [Thermodesulfobacteriota bacterium]|nr:radical SAM protein [Thermodesulfobacteriota bacterium]